MIFSVIYGVSYHQLFHESDKTQYNMLLGKTWSVKTEHHDANGRDMGCILWIFERKSTVV